MLLLLLATAHATTLAELTEALAEIADASLESPEVQADWEALKDALRIRDSPESRAEFARVRLAHELFRAGGLAGTRWTITDEPPRSDAIWAQWSEGATVADAECDELSALFAFMGRRMGVRHLGLFWPTSNHTVAVWTVDGEAGPARVLVPTSQIFLPASATLGDKGFDPWTQRTIYDYGRKDLAADATLPDALVERVLQGARTWATASAAALTRRRLGDPLDPARPPSIIRR